MKNKHIYSGRKRFCQKCYRKTFPLNEEICSRCGELYNLNKEKENGTE